MQKENEYYTNELLFKGEENRFEFTNSVIRAAHKKLFELKKDGLLDQVVNIVPLVLDDLIQHKKEALSLQANEDKQ